MAQARLTVSGTPSFVQKWRPPTGSSYKLNFDAAVFSDTSSSGFGAVIRNNLGEVMPAMSAKGLEWWTARRPRCFPVGERWSLPSMPGSKG